MGADGAADGQEGLADVSEMDAGVSGVEHVHPLMTVFWT